MDIEKQYRSEIESLHRLYLGGATPTELVDSLREMGLQGIAAIAVAMKALRLPLRYAKGAGVWVNQNLEVSNPDELDAEMGPIIDAHYGER